MILIAAALLVLVVAGVAGLVALGVWESRMAESAPRRGALLVAADELLAARRAGGETVAEAPARALRPVRALRAALAQG
ncbi:hypothetical protein [Quadrisphaera sp. INWT6]|uniref:hypothetical protein n=1 Tax=Quadrisphaera sp. INWT6 TaxID=2596917 RepID=UPI0018921845|nr:hypothetical protein [Quadrisphaera sp. INWT6]MBF5080333.1 hypothetical protein [Quadrisphaera sp. INWT6]